MTAVSTVSARATEKEVERRASARVTTTRWFVPYLFLLPAVVLFALFYVWPLVTTIQLSFYKYNVVTPARWVGLANFTQLIHDPLFWQSLGNSLLYTLGAIPFGVILPLLLAVLVNRRIRGIGVYRLIYYLPVVTMTVAVSIAWEFVFNRRGALNWLLTSLGVINQPVNWLLDPRFALWALVVVAGWQNMGYFMMIFLAGLQSIPSELYDAAAVDGCNGWRRLWYITVPLLRPYIAVCLILTCLGAMQTFTTIYVMTQGGPDNATTSLGYYIWQQAFQNFNMGYANAMGIAFWLILIVMSLINFRLTAREVT
jgi:putative chitobiose transport system permease protein